MTPLPVRRYSAPKLEAMALALLDERWPGLAPPKGISWSSGFDCGWAVCI